VARQEELPRKAARDWMDEPLGVERGPLICEGLSSRTLYKKNYRSLKIKYESVEVCDRNM
jgi:hypothetical protein